MKTLVKMLMCIACVALLSSCEKQPEIIRSEKPPDPTTNFEVNFIVHDVTKGEPIITSNGCLNKWRGEGESQILGKFSVEISLECDMSNLRFCNLIGTFHSADGSTLLFHISEGEYLPADDSPPFFHITEGEYLFNNESGCPVFQFSFNNLAEFRGGTGRFAEARGGFNPNALIHNEEAQNWFASFSCRGNLQLNSENHPNPIY